MTLQIRVGGIVIDGAPLNGLPPGGGFFVRDGGFDGWEDSTDARRDAVARPSAHGEFDFPVWQSARVISIDGFIIAPTDVELGHMRNRLVGIGAAGDSFQVTVDLQGKTRWVRARRGMTRVKDTGIRSGWHRASFQWQCVAADPRKYGEERSFPAGVEAVQLGNFPARPVLQVGAGSGGYTITGSAGRVITVGASAPAGSHRIDLSTGGLFLPDGSRVAGAITVWQPWTIGPGSPGVTHSITGSRSLTVEVCDTDI